MKKSMIVAAIAVALGGCATSGVKLEKVSDKDMQEFLADKPPEVHDHYRNVLVEGERNAVLNRMRTGLAAYELGDKEAARRDLDEVLQRVEAIYADTPGARQARKRFVAEKAKEFKGESYERAMAYYYRGLLFLEEEDYENARASFVSALLQDTLAEEEGYAADFASVEWLAGWAAHCQAKSGRGTDSFSRLATEHFQRAAGQRSSLDRPRRNHDLLVVYETGAAPVKVASDRGVEYLEYQRGRTRSVPAVKVAAQPLRMVLGEDIYFQASTRGGRQVDVVNAGKAEFKQSATETAAVAGDVAKAGLATAQGLLELGSSVGAQSDDLFNAAGVAGAVGLFSALVGGVSSSVAARTKPDADLRYWDNLPDKVYLGSTRLTKTSGDREIRMAGKSVEPSPNWSQPATCRVAWARTDSATAVPATHPNAR